MAAVIHYLLHHPEWHARATEEIRSTYASDEDILLDSALSSCKVFLACVDETQRLIPTASTVPQERWTLAASQLTSPNSFKPDRWLVHEETAAEDEERIKHQKRAHMPFPHRTEIL
jgi:hypothetical protein